MTYVLGQILYRATVRLGNTVDSRICYEEFIVVKVTAKGGWVTEHLPPHDVSVHMGDSFTRRWVPLNGKFCSPSKEAALSRLRARTRSYVRHARRRLRDAEERAQVLGLDTTEPLFRSHDSAWDWDH